MNKSNLHFKLLCLRLFLVAKRGEMEKARSSKPNQMSFSKCGKSIWHFLLRAKREFLSWRQKNVSIHEIKPLCGEMYEVGHCFGLAMCVFLYSKRNSAVCGGTFDRALHSSRRRLTQVESLVTQQVQTEPAKGRKCRTRCFEAQGFFTNET